MNWKAVLFDMDGTVLDTLDDLADSVNRSLAEFIRLVGIFTAKVENFFGSFLAELSRSHCLTIAKSLDFVSGFSTNRHSLAELTRRVCFVTT